MRKQDELSKLITETSAKWSNMFYIISLLLLSLYNFFKTNEIGIDFIILIIGLGIFFITYYIKTRNVSTD